MNETDIAVVGGGIIGAVVSRELVSALPGARITVFERDLIGQGASSRSAGVHFPRGGNERVRSMSEFSHHYWQRHIAECELPVRDIACAVVAPDASADVVEESYLELAELRPLPLDQVDVRGWSRPSGTRAWSVRGCHYADVPSVARRLLTALRGSTTVWEGSAVVAIDGDGDGYRLTLSHGAELRARQVVLTQGPWVNRPPWTELTATLGIRIKKIVSVHVDVTPRPDEELTIFHGEDAFLLPVHHRGHLLFSYTCDEWDVDPDSVVTGLAPGDLTTARAVLGHYSPWLADRCRSGRVFCDAYSAAGAPVVAELSPGLVVASAAGGSGYRLAPAIATEVVAALGATPTTATPVGARNNSER
ncbi:NAD(P)/FAD-dependent oxidoreductase [Haloechinothrix halophila]|uniref:NAD(P)/FAD-dependent oxidoreductase n=1 Tax=Haloechinothrix halophila TaxID=1069073 RepID=UPI0004279BAC|nr:FAD-dependent oxidoreductase [Haloechinothrix halophila]